MSSRNTIAALVIAILLICTSLSILACEKCRSDCGSRALSSAAAILGVKVNQSVLKQYSKESDVSPSDLVYIAKKMKLSAKEAKIPCEDLPSLTVPAVLQIWDNHYVLVEGQGNDKIRYTDPPNPPKIIPALDIKTTYSGFAVLVARRDEQFPEPAMAGPDLRFDWYTCDFGLVDQDAKIEKIVKFRNVGAADLNIRNARGTCGCTPVIVSQKTIPPQGEGELKIDLQYCRDLAKAFPNEPEVFEYYEDMILFRWLPVPLHPIIGKDVQTYIKAGITGIAPLTFERYSNWAYGPNSYVFGKALWRGEGRPKDIEDYCSDVYGPAGAHMKEYFDMLFELTATAMETCGYSIPTDLRSAPFGQPFAKSHAAQLLPLISDERLNAIESKLREASANIPEVYRSRVENQRHLFNYVRLETRNIYMQISLAAEFTEAMSINATNADRQRVIAKIEAAIPDFINSFNDASSIVLCASPDLTGKIIFEDFRARSSMNWEPWDLRTMIDQLKAKIAQGK